LPERLSPVERTREEAAGQARELLVVARRPEHVALEVVAEIEIRCRFPGGMRELERHRRHPLRVARNEMQPGPDVGEQLSEVERAVYRVDSAHVQELARPLEMPERGIESRQAVAVPLHGHRISPRAGTSPAP